MSLDLIRAAIKTIMEDVSGIGKVHDYQRLTHEWKQYQKLFTKDDIVNMWEIERAEVRRWVEATQGPAGGVERVIHTFILRGFYRVNDTQESDKTFQNLVEGVCQAFRTKPTLKVSGTSYAEVVHESEERPIVGIIYKDFLGAVLCHVADISVSVQEKVTFTA